MALGGSRESRPDAYDGKGTEIVYVSPCAVIGSEVLYETISTDVQPEIMPRSLYVLVTVPSSWKKKSEDVGEQQCSLTLSSIDATCFKSPLSLSVPSTEALFP